MRSMQYTLEKSSREGSRIFATQEILRWAFENVGLEKDYLNVLSDNEKAIRLYEKCGFVYEWELRKHIVFRGEYRSLKWYSILREEYFHIADDLK